MLGRVLTALLDLVVPQSCVGCGAPGEACCAGCLAVSPASRMPGDAPSGLPECWSAGPYEGALRKALLAYKERGQAALARPLSEALALTAVRALAAHPGSALAVARVPAARPGPGGERVAVVPVPSSGRALRARGHDPVGRLAVLAARRLREFGLPAEPWRALRQARRVADQAGLSSTQRADNLAASLWVPDAAYARTGPLVLLVDDIVTTGSTLAEAARTLRAAGARVPLAVTVAATRRRS
jgi:predicted amidophosphoribosyltransferase